MSIASLHDIRKFQVACIKATGEDISDDIAKRMLDPPPLIGKSWIKLIYRRAKYFDDELENGSIWDKLRGTYTEAK